MEIKLRPDNIQPGQRPVTKADLLRALEDYPDDVVLLVEGYEEGFDELIALEEVEVEFRPNAEPYNGQYAALPDADSPAISEHTPKMLAEWLGEKRKDARPAGKALVFRSRRSS